MNSYTLLVMRMVMIMTYDKIYIFLRKLLNTFDCEHWWELMACDAGVSTST